MSGRRARSSVQGSDVLGGGKDGGGGGRKRGVREGLPDLEKRGPIKGRHQGLEVRGATDGRKSEKPVTSEPNKSRPLSVLKG